MLHLLQIDLDLHLVVLLQLLHERLLVEDARAHLLDLLPDVEVELLHHVAVHLVVISARLQVQVLLLLPHDAVLQRLVVHLHELVVRLRLDLNLLRLACSLTH